MKYLRQALKTLTSSTDSPEHTALSFAVGIFFGFSPLLGFHTLLGLSTAFVFRLNKVALMLGVWANVPWIVVPYYAFCTWIGVQLLGMPPGIGLPEVGLSELLSATFWRWLVSQWPLLVPAFVGSLLICTLLAGLSYPAVLLLLRRMTRRRRQTASDVL